MAGTVRIKMNYAGIGELLNDPGVRADLTRRMERVESAARASAPVATSEYHDSIGVEQATTDRAVVRVAATAPHAMLVESRTGNLARALDSAGGA